MQSFSHHMHPEDYLYMKFLWLRRRRNLVLGLLVSFWFGIIPLLNQTPMLMAGVTSIGILAFLQLLADLHRCDTAWSGLWETLVMRARSARGKD